MKLKKWITLLLCGTLALGLAGCGNLYTNALTVDGTEISSGLYLMFQYNANSVAQSRVEDQTKDKFKQTVEGKKTIDWIRGRTEEHCRRYVATQRLFREYKLKLSEDAESLIDQALGSWSYVEESYTKNGISQSTYLRYLTNEQQRSALFDMFYAEDGPFGVSDEDLKAEYEEKFAQIRSYSFPITNSAGDKEVDTVTPFVEQALKAVQDGSMTMDEAVADYGQQISDVLERTFNAESAPNNITTSYVAYEYTEGGAYPEDFHSALKGQAVGDFGITTTESNVILYEKIAVYSEDEDFSEMRSTVVSNLRQSTFDDYLRDIYNAYEVSWVLGSRNYLSPKNIV